MFGWFGVRVLVITFSILSGFAMWKPVFCGLPNKARSPDRAPMGALGCASGVIVTVGACSSGIPTGVRVSCVNHESVESGRASLLLVLRSWISEEGSLRSREVRLGRVPGTEPCILVPQHWYGSGSHAVEVPCQAGFSAGN